MNFVNVAVYGNWIKMILWGAPDNLTKVSVDMLKTATPTETTKKVFTTESSAHVNSTKAMKVNSSNLNTTLKPQKGHDDDKIAKTVNTTTDDFKEVRDNLTTIDSITSSTFRTQSKSTTKANKSNSDSTTTFAPSKNHIDIKNVTTSLSEKDTTISLSTAALISTSSNPTSAKPIIEEVKNAVNVLLTTSTSHESSTLSTLIPSASISSSQDDRIAKALDFNTTTPKISPVLENVIMSKSVTNIDTSRNTLLNEIAENSSTLASNSTEENQALLAQFNLPPWMIIGGAFAISLGVLFLIFCILGQGKAKQHH